MTASVPPDVKKALAGGRPEEALLILRASASPADDFSLQSQYARLAKTLAESLPRLPAWRVAFLAGSTLNHWVEALRFWLLLEGFRLEPYLAPFGAWRQEALNPDSGLYAFKAEAAWFFLTARDVPLAVEFGAGQRLADETATAAAADVLGPVKALLNRVPLLPIVNNLEGRRPRLFGNYEAAVPWSPDSLRLKFNECLARSLPPGAIIFDLAGQAAVFGLARWEDPRLWFHSKHPFSLEAIGPVAFAAARLLAAARGRARKALILDLDNTLWGGVTGDDGVSGLKIGDSGGAVGEAFRAFQVFLKDLAGRGLALAVCSKNDEALARAPFNERPEMVLKLADFAAFRANWSNKADNIKSLAAELNLGLEALVFVDDNPAERALVRALLPEVAVPEMPPDPADYIPALAAGAWFETLSFSEEDGRRGRAYQAEARRVAAKEEAADLSGYLAGLEMTAAWGRATYAQLPRMTQLFNKTNQFNLMTVRHTEADLAALAAEPDIWPGWFTLADRFGDYGLVAAVVLSRVGHKAIVLEWVMSCRVFSRGLEDFTWRILWNLALGYGCRHLDGRFRPTAKNGAAARLYERFGGLAVEAPSADESRWLFDLSVPPPLFPIHIMDRSSPQPGAGHAG
jgi:FkbH-like protein